MANIFHVEREANKITLGTTGTTVNIASHTASKILALDASKNLEVVTIGTSLSYARPTLNTIQDIRTTASPTFAGLTINGAISSATMTITESADDTDVSGVNTLFVNTTGGDVILGGLVGGVDGQKLSVIKIVAVNDLILEHEEGIGGDTDDFFMHQIDDEIIDSGGVPLVFNGTTEKWYDVSHAKHV